MSHFFPLDGSVILVSSGVFSEHQLYVDAENTVFARKGNGYIRLMDHQATSKHRTFWRNFTTDRVWEVNMGRITLTNTSRRQSIAAPKPKAA